MKVLYPDQWDTNPAALPGRPLLTTAQCLLVRVVRRIPGTRLQGRRSGIRLSDAGNWLRAAKTSAWHQLMGTWLQVDRHFPRECAQGQNLPLRIPRKPAAPDSHWDAGADFEPLL